MQQSGDRHQGLPATPGNWPKGCHGDRSRVREPIWPGKKRRKRQRAGLRYGAKTMEGDGVAHMCTNRDRVRYVQDARQKRRGPAPGFFPCSHLAGWGARTWGRGALMGGDVWVGIGLAAATMDDPEEAVRAAAADGGGGEETKNETRVAAA